MTQFLRFRRAAIALILAAMSVMAVQPAFAGVPEIVLDPRTSKAVPLADLEAALVALSFPIAHVELNWRRAPWIAK